jgi:hypothetical protein
VEQTVPLIEKYSREDDDELREYCLQAFEAFVQKCPKEVSPHIKTVSRFFQTSTSISFEMFFRL